MESTIKPGAGSALLALAVALAAAGCGEGGDRTGIRVVATTAIAADIARQLAGDDAEVRQLFPDSAGAHDYGLSARNRRDVDEADLLVLFGPGLEAALPLGELDTRRFEINRHVGELRHFSEEEHEEEEDGEHAEGEHGHGSEDPHVWMDPTRVARALPQLAAALAEADPDHAPAYRRRATEFAGRLRALDRRIARELERVPRARRKLIASHESIGYFADRYGFEFVGAPFGQAPEAQASAGRLADLIREIRRQRIPAVFAQREDDPKVLRRVAREAGVELVDDLLVEGLGPNGPSYEKALLFDARRVAGALQPGVRLKSDP